MASIFGSPPFLSHPITKPHFSSSSQTPPPPPTPPSQPQSPTPSPQLTTSSSEQQPPVSVKVEQQKPKKRSTVDTTDWIASSLTRRFGLGAGLAWAAFLAVGVISEQIKTRIEVSQQEADTRFVISLHYPSQNCSVKLLCELANPKSIYDRRLMFRGCSCIQILCKSENPILQLRQTASRSPLIAVAV
jgi:hypothetical protein